MRTPELSRLPTAYNNLLVVGNYAYIPVDYCGLLVVDVSTPLMSDVNWINPWGCTTTNWDGRPGHTNQLVNIGDSLLFVSGGDTEILVYDITDKANPVLTGQRVFLLNNEVSWGIDVRENYVATAMVDNPFGIPYDSDWGGIQLFEWKAEVLSVEEEPATQLLQLYPNPASDRVLIRNCPAGTALVLSDLSGRSVRLTTYTDEGLELEGLSPGVYLVSFPGTENGKTLRLIIR